MAESLLQGVKAAFASGRTLNLDFRRRQLKNLQRMYNECADEILEALHKDLKKSKMEGQIYELEVLKSDVHELIINLEKWTKDEYLPFNLLAIPDSAFVRKDPFGVVLIIGTWNYPFSMILQPLQGAIASGNCAIVKPSEVTSSCSATMARIIPKYLDPECYKVYEGDVQQTIQLLNLKFDYIFYTGSGNVGKSIMETCSKNLIPCTLELGGKSPVYIDEKIDITIAARRILWGKCVNSGQTCIAPDYILCSKKQEQAFLNAASKILVEWLGENSHKNEDYTRIVNNRHFHRVKKLLESTKGRIVMGGETDEKSLYIAPTLVVDLDPETDPLMADEIFGPILPIITVESAEEAIKFILNRPKPLSLYVFSNNNDIVQKFLNKTSSGGVCINDVMMQNGWAGLPFGGVGASGLGNYHGKYSIDTFTHKKAVLHRQLDAFTEKILETRNFPYSDRKMKFWRFALGWVTTFNVSAGQFVTHTAAAIIGAAIVFSICQFSNAFS